MDILLCRADSNFNLSPLFPEGGKGWFNIIKYIQQTQGCFKGDYRAVTINQTVIVSFFLIT